ncbi:glycosyltransferase family 2 protein [Loigolactobacillus backii]|uniref:Ribonuclease III n=1 Tax=Loigolactobacillus backii TaxID=375175 RepID=A0A192H0M1_9LACO|nr:glycosyltransferase family 2 protein [Loigolactobacillus backii]ANK60641.1 ribonuclease III [Loigolactobacillus backii]ANK61792.1 ribonuclease III [Loigolactobacillus backii]ANK65594.1 ribonuclease III [Loigolactobacillus backii]ANK68066.1 ribonuclease III [Loigolactobacillus backii]ANK69014.1 ribonuclease III [Loigolactobacillus backii]
MEKLTIVVPAFNEEEVLPSTIKRLLQVENDLIKDLLFDQKSDILIVDDGSTDKTWDIIKTEHQNNDRVAGIKFSRNFGHQNALIAGMQTAVKTAAVIVTIDADLQDDPTAIAKMAAKFANGTDIVYGVRNNRATDTWFKRNTALMFYKTLNLLGVKLIQNHADFRLMSKRAIQTLLQYKERNLFIRGIIPMLGFKTDKVYYKRTPRLAGESKYPLKKMIAFAWDGLTSFSIAPVRAILLLGVLASSLGVIALFYSVITKWLGLTVHGWSSLMISIWILGGLQMFSLGIIGEYIGKLTTESKQRPRFTIETTIGE